jgi:DNA-binding winged helix-turn-helix (wHTH) protein/tetratricopeptide (TPR) repeat protein
MFMQSVATQLQFGEFILDRSRRQLRRGGQSVALAGKAFDLLAYMAANPGRPLLKEELLKTVWPDSFVEESNLSQNVFLVRKALGTAGEGAIQTLSGRGYLFTAHVVEVGLPLSAPVQATGLSLEATETRIVFEEDIEEHVPFWRSPVTLGFAVAALTLLGIAAWLGWQRYEDRVGGPPVQVVIADSDGSTGDPVLDRALSSVFRTELAQSPFVTVLSGAKVKAKLTQMQHKPDETVTVELAREVCERSGSQAVVHGTVAKAGNRYILTEEATNCVDGTTVGQASRDVSRQEDLPAALVKLANQIRHDLGESRRTIARFSHPLSPVTTGSLEALKDMTEAERMMALGRGPEAEMLLKQAVALDPNFAGAWLDLSTYSLNNRELVAGREYLTKAYNLRQNQPEPTQRFIVARYNGEVTGDLYESLHNYQTWVDEYPGNPVPWSGLDVVNNSLGRIPDELNSAQHLMNITSAYQVVFEGLAEAQRKNGDFAASRATLEAAIAKGFNGDTIHRLLADVAYITHDPALLAEQDTWAHQHPFAPYTLSQLAFIAQIEGRTSESERRSREALDACRHLGMEELCADITAQMLIDEAGLDQPDLAKRWMATLTPNPESLSYLYALQYTGDTARMEALLKDQLAAHPRSTLWNDWDGPLLHGKSLLDAHKPREALAALEPTRAFDGKDVDGIYLRGLANLELRQFPEAEAEFRKILDHPGIDPTAFQRPLARLQLARTLAQEGRKPAAAESYNAFLTSWAHADPGQPLVLAARKELEALAHTD